MNAKDLAEATGALGRAFRPLIELAMKTDPKATEEAVRKILESLDQMKRSTRSMFEEIDTTMLGERQQIDSQIFTNTHNYPV